MTILKDALSAQAARFSQAAGVIKKASEGFSERNIQRNVQIAIAEAKDAKKSGGT